MGNWVYLRLQSYRQTSVALRHKLKLSAKFYGPFQIVRRVGSVAYKLQLPAGSSMHPVFHVSMLKKKLGNRVTPILDLPATQEEETLIASEQVLATRNN